MSKNKFSKLKQYTLQLSMTYFKEKRRHIAKLKNARITQVLNYMVLVFLSFNCINAQQFMGSAAINPYDSGLSPNRRTSSVEPPVAFSGVENPDNYSFKMSIPILSLLGRGINANLNLTYDSGIYQADHQSPVISVSNYARTPGLGFYFNFGMLVRHNNSQSCRITKVSGNGFCPSSNGSSPGTMSDITFIESDGTQHRFRKGISIDGSGLKLGNDTSGNFIVIYPNGLQILFNSGVSIGSGVVYGDTFLGSDAVCRQTCNIFDSVMLPGKITDRNGNYIIINKSGLRISSIIDTLGRQIIFRYSDNLVEVAMPGFGNNGEIVLARIYLQAANRIYGFATYNNYQEPVTLVRQVVVPGNKTGWNFDYNSYGMIYKVQKLKNIIFNPNGSIASPGDIVASTEYDYPINPSNLSTVPKYYHRTDKWLKNPSSINPEYAERQYEFDTQIVSSGGQYKTITNITSRENHSVSQTVKRYYTPQQIYDSEQFDNWYPAQDYGAVLEQRLFKNGIQYSSIVNSWQNTSGGIRLTNQTITNETGQAYATTYSYYDPVLISNDHWSGVFNNIHEVKEYDYDGSLIRRKEITYENDSNYTNLWLVKLQKSIKFYEGNQSVPINFIQYNYDESSLTSCPSIAMNLSVGGQRGNLTSIRTYTNAAEVTGLIENKFEYDLAGNTVKIIDPLNRVTTVSYIDNFNSPDGEAHSNASIPELVNQSNAITYAFPTSTSNVLGHTVYSQYDYYTGKVVDTEDVNGVVSTIFYEDPMLRPTQIINANNVSNLKKQIKNIYDDANLKIIKTSDLESFNDNLLKSEVYMDGNGRNTEFRDYESDGSYTAVQYIYDLYDNTTFDEITKISNPYNPVHNEQVFWAENKFDALARIYEIKNTDNSKTTITYEGNITTTTDQSGKKIRSVTDAVGRVIKVEEPNNQNQLGANSPITTYVYDALNNIRFVNQGSQTRTFEYDSLSRLKQITNPESGVIKYTYDNAGNLQTQREDRGIKTIYDYDSLNRLIKKCYRNIGISAPLGMTTCLNNTETAEANTPDVAYAYDDVTNAKGKLTKITATRTGTNAFSAVTDYQAFDKLGRVTQSQQTVDGVSYGTTAQTYTYNLAGAIIEEKYPSGRVVKNVLDTDGDLSIVQSKKNANAGYWNYAKSFTYTAAGAVSSMQLGNGRWESTVFNSRLQPEQIALGTTQNGTDKLKLNYEYGKLESNGTIIAGSNNGNVAKQLITVPNVGSNLGFMATQFYTYDELNRLKQASESITQNQTTVNTWSQTFDYDRYGNRNFNEAGTTASLSFPKSCGTTQNPVMCTGDRKIFNPEMTVSNRLKEDQDNDLNKEYEYDAVGNLTKDANGRKFTYDGENRQTRIDEVVANDNVIGIVGEYYYDGDGKRVKKIIGNEVTIFVYDALGKLIAEYSTTVASAPTAQVNYLTTDHLGSPRINTDTNGTVKARHDYQPFGEEINSTITLQRNNNLNYINDPIRQKFTSYERDNESGLDFAQARYYGYGYGRFLSPDPLMASANPIRPQSWNRYSYSYNNPLRFSDPTGMVPEWVHKNGEVFYDSRVINQETATELYGEGAIYRPNGYEYTASDTSKIELGNYGFFKQDGVVKDNGDRAEEALKNQPVDHSGTILKGGLTISGGLLADDVTGIGVGDDPLIPVVVAGTAATALIMKAVYEISKIQTKTSGPQGVQYSLRATTAGAYTCYTCATGTMNLNPGDVWKYGETINPTSRYSDPELGRIGGLPVEQINEFSGSQVEIKVAEKAKIYAYFLIHKQLPPGNKIFRQL